MIEALFQASAETVEAAQAVAPYVPGGAVLIAAFVLRSVLSPVLKPAAEAAEAIRDYFKGQTEREEAHAEHLKAEAAHWAIEEQLLQHIAGQGVPNQVERILTPVEG